MFAAREYEREIELYNNRHRYLDPSRGSFTQEDPIGFAAGTTNTYLYAENNPESESDPYGLFSFDFDKFSEYVDERKFSNFYTLLGVTSNAAGNTFATYPRAGLAGKMAGAPSSWLSTLGQKYPIALPFRLFSTNNALRALGRGLTAYTVFEGYYDIGTILISAWDATTFVEKESNHCKP